MPDTRGVSASQSGTGIRVIQVFLLNVFFGISESDFFMKTKKPKKRARPGEMAYL